MKARANSSAALWSRSRASTMLKSAFLIMALWSALHARGQITDPYFASQPPSSETVVSGGNITLIGAAGGTTPISYQWQLNGVNISGATVASYVASAAGTYKLVASNSAGSANSVNCVVTVVTVPPDPYFNLQPHAGSTVLVGNSITACAQASGTAPINYQWQFNGANISGATSSCYSFVNATHAMAGTYQLVATNPKGSVTSASLILTVADPPVITSQPQSQIVAAGVACTLNVTASSAYPALSYTWSQQNGVQFNPSYLSALTFNPVTSRNAGNYSVTVNAPSPPGGSVVSSTATLTLFGLPGTCTAWGYNANGQATVPVGLTNISRLAAGWYHTVALQDNGTVVAWGDNTYGQATPPSGLNDVVAIAASRNHSLALKGDGTVVGWGYGVNGSAGPPPINNNIIAIGAGVNWSLALRSDGTVQAWGDNSFGQLNVPAGLTGVTCIACSHYHALALKSDGTVVAWGLNSAGQCNVPGGLNGVVQVSAGEVHSLALKSNGTVVGWGADTFGEISGLSSLNNVMQVSAGSVHSLALKTDGSLVACGNNVSGQSVVPAGLGNTLYPQISIAAGHAFSTALTFSGTVDYPVNVNTDLLLVYNSASPNSIALLNYYLANRPKVSTANTLAINPTPGVDTTYANYQSTIKTPIMNWLTANPTKRPRYIVFFLDVPGRIFDSYNNPNNQSVAYALSVDLGPLTPSVSHINMGALADCEAYIDKVKAFGNQYSPGRLDIAPSSGGYPDYMYYIDDANDLGGSVGTPVKTALLGAGVPLANIIVSTQGHLNGCANIASYFSWGVHNGLPWSYAIDGTITFNPGLSGWGGWYTMFTDESFNGMTHPDQLTYEGAYQGNYIDWFAANAFGGSSHLNAPVGAVSSVNEPFVQAPDFYFAMWASGKRLGSCSFAFLVGAPVFAQSSGRSQAQPIGDPFLRR